MSAEAISLSAHFTGQHREADELWAGVEAAVEKRDAAKIKDAYQRFERSLRQHLLLEEEVLFPEFEKATGMTQGPTAVMRGEHRQMRALLDQMQVALASADHEALMDGGDTLLTLIQQHNMKEENMLYRMCEQHLAAQWPDIRERAKSYV